MNTENIKTDNNAKVASGVGLFAALAASLCCITPVLVLLAGASGAASAFSWLDPARPFLIALAIAALGFAWYKTLKANSAEACDTDGKCVTEKKSFLASRTFLTIVTIAAVVLMAFPYYGKIFYPKSNNQTVVVSSEDVQQVSFKVSGMTCASCEETIKLSVNKLPGIIETKVDYKSGKTSVKYDGTKTNKVAIIDAINATGYKAGDEITSQIAIPNAQRIDVRKRSCC